MTSAFVYRDAHRGAAGRIEVGFTERRLDFGDRAPDGVRRAALAEVEAECSARPVLMHQVHGAAVAVVEGPGPHSPAGEVDALVSREPGLALVARAADCVPVLLADPEHGVIAAVHAGRPGIAAGVVPEAVARMRDLGAEALHAWIGPHVCGACYEVPEALRAEVAALVPETFATTSWGTPSLDLGAGVRAQLVAAGARTTAVGQCTREDTAWPSYRRDGTAATRFAGVIWRVA